MKMPTYIVSPYIYDFLMKHSNLLEEVKKEPKLEGGILQYIPDGNLFDNEKNVGTAFVKACDQLKELVNENPEKSNT